MTPTSQQPEARRGAETARPVREHKFTIASRYIESLRHHAKRKYAREYYQWHREGQPDGKIPAIPPASTLSYMAAQGVRMELDEILGCAGLPGCDCPLCVTRRGAPSLAEEALARKAAPGVHLSGSPGLQFQGWYEQQCEENRDYDPTPYCGICKAMTSEGCSCPPEAEQTERETLRQLASPASQMRSVQATTMAHLANVVHAEAAFRACTWNLLVHLSHQPYVDVVVSRRADKSAMGPVTIVDLWFRVGHYTFRAEGVASVKEVNGFVNITLA